MRGTVTANAEDRIPIQLDMHNNAPAIHYHANMLFHDCYTFNAPTSPPVTYGEESDSYTYSFADRFHAISMCCILLFTGLFIITADLCFTHAKHRAGDTMRARSGASRRWRYRAIALKVSRCTSIHYVQGGLPKAEYNGYSRTLRKIRSLSHHVQCHLQADS